MSERKYARHYEKTVLVKEEANIVFAFADDHRNFSSHMNKSSMMMGGGSMKTETDQGDGKKIGSHIRMTGKILGLNLYLDEVIIEHEYPYRKAWETVGDINLLVVDHYKLGFEIAPKGRDCELKVFIDYNLPQSWKTYLLPYLKLIGHDEVL